MIQTFLVPTVGRQINAQGNFFRYESADPSATDQTVKVRADGNDLGTYLPGDSIELPITASLWEITPTTGPATVRVGNGRIVTNRSTLVGQVSATVLSNKAPISDGFVNTPKTVTSASTQLIAANAARQYLMVQNKDGAGSIYLNFGAGAATVANGLLIPAGGYFEWFCTQAPDAVQAIGSIASNANVLVIEG